MYLVKTPWLLKKLYPKLIWDAPADTRCIYLTFDDGPIPIVTPYVLNILKQYNAKATFFCIGDNVRKYPDIFADLKKEGHTVANHTYNHLRGWDTPDNVYLQNFLKADELICSNLFRPPYGRMRRSQVELLKQARPDIKIMMWTVLSGDFDMSLKPKDCIANVTKNTQPGSIVLFHDSVKAFGRLEDTLPAAMEYWAKEGYTFEALEII